MLKFVYALISSREDYILEQACLSMYSLKKHNPEAKITLLTDNATFESLKGGRSIIKEYVDEVIIENPPNDFNPTEKSRYLKTSLRRLVNGDFLYLDNDTIITDSLAELEKFNGDIGAVKDHHEDAVRDGMIIHGQIYDYLAKTKKKFWGYPVYFNGGVLLVKDSPASNKFFEDWHRLWREEREKYGIQIDQPALAQTNNLNDNLIKEINGVYNSQFLLHSGKSFLFSAKVYHYYANSELATSFLLNDKKILDKVRNQGIIPEIEDILSFPLKAHLQKSIILCGQQKDIYNSPIVILSRILSQKHNWTNNIARFLFKIRKLPLH